MHAPFYSEMQTKDAIARELLDLDEQGEVAEAIDEAYADTFDVSVDIESNADGPDFLNDERETEVDILTGDAE